MWKMSCFCFGLQSSNNIYTSIIIFELRLRAEDHEKEFLIRSILEYLTVGSDFLKFPLIHKVNDRSEISSVSREPIWCPGENRIVPSLPESFKESIESFASSWSFRRFTFPDDLYNIELISFCHLSHRFYLRFYRKGLPFVIFWWFSHIEAVGSYKSFFSESSNIFPWISSLCLRFHWWWRNSSQSSPEWSFESGYHSIIVSFLQHHICIFPLVSLGESQRKRH